MVPSGSKALWKHRQEKDGETEEARRCMKVKAGTVVYTEKLSCFVFSLETPDLPFQVKGKSNVFKILYLKGKNI